MPDVTVPEVLDSQWLLVVAGAALGLLLVWLGIRAVRARGRGPGSRVDGRRVDMLLTALAALIATGVAATGMWRFFGDVLRIESTWLRAALFAFLEIALFVSAIRARRNLLDDLARIAQRRGEAEKAAKTAWSEADREAAEAALVRAAGERASTGVDGVAVWALAGMSGVFAAMDARSVAEAVFRLAAPLVAAWLWERGLAAERRQIRGGASVNWKITPERVLVALGMAEPTGRGVGEVDQARRLARLARTAFRLHTLRVTGAARWRVAAATRRLRRQTEAANEHLGLARDPKVRKALRLHLAVLYQTDEGTSPAAVAELAPWGATGAVAGVLADTVDVEPPATAAGTRAVDLGLVVDHMTEPKIGDESEQRDQLRAILRRELRPEDGYPDGRTFAELAREYGPHVPGLTVARAQQCIEEFFAEVDRWLQSLSLEELRRVSGPGEYRAKLMVRQREDDAAMAALGFDQVSAHLPSVSGAYDGHGGVDPHADARSTFPELSPPGATRTASPQVRMD